MGPLATNQTGEEHSCLILSEVAATLIASKKPLISGNKLGILDLKSRITDRTCKID